MEVNDFLSEHKICEFGFERTNKLKEKYKDDVKLKVLIDLFDYDFDYVDLIKYYGIDFSWEGESFKILEEIFGDYAELVRHAWNLKQDCIYQEYYFRRSFRAPNNKLLLLQTKINFIKDLLYSLVYDFDIFDYVKYAYAIGYYSRNFCFLFSCEVAKNGNENLYQLMLDIVYGRSDEGKIDSSIIKALLLLDRDESRKAIKDLLLSAQRQEGLRQTILEVLDEAHPNNLKYILTVILKNNLVRFSSVVRAFNVWTGLDFIEPRKKTVLKGFELAVKYLNDEEIINGTDKGINKLLNIKDVFEIYMALWAVGVNDIEKTSKIIEDLLQKDDNRIKMVTLYFINETQIDFNDKIKDYLISNNITLAYLALRGIKLPKYVDNDIFEKIGDLGVFYNKKDVKNLKNMILELFKITNKKSKIENVVFSWFNLSIDKYEAMDKLLSFSDIFKDYEDLIEYFDDMNADERNIFISSYLDEPRWVYQNEPIKKKELTFKQKRFTIDALADRSENVRDIAMRALNRVKSLDNTEILNIEKLLKRKSATLRKGLLKLLATQNDENFLNSAKRLVKCSTTEERTAGLDILLLLKDESLFSDEINVVIDELREKKRITLKEKNLLNILEGKTGEVYSLENGFGIYDPDKLTKSITPKIVTPYWKKYKIAKDVVINDINDIDKDNVNVDNINSINISDEDKSPWFRYSIPFSEVMGELKSLDNLIEKYKDVEYEIEMYNGSLYTRLVGDWLTTKKYNVPNNLKEKYKDFVLYDKWIDWFKNSKLKPYDLELILVSLDEYTLNSLDVCADKVWKTLVHNHIPGNFSDNNISKEFNFHQQLAFLLRMFNELYPYENRAELILKSYENLLANIPKDKLTKQIPCAYEENIYWQDLGFASLWLNRLNFRNKLNKNQTLKLWKLNKWRYESSITKNFRYLPSLLTYAMAYEKGMIHNEDIYHSLFVSDYLSDITSKHYANQVFNIMEEYPFLKELSIPVIDRILEIELKRGDSPTTFSNLIQHINRIEGSDRFFKVLLGIDKENFARGYGYGISETKKDNFSKILKVLYPNDKDNFEEFKKQYEKSGVSMERLVEAGLYSPQWLEFVSFTLGWDGFVSASWWLNAHTSDYKDEQKQSEIGKYTKISIADFLDGAVDVDWFNDCYGKLGKNHWEILYDGAKYISTGNGHRRAKIFSDALIGNLSEKEVIAKIESKNRDKEYLRALGLLPLSKKSNIKEKTVLKRYNFIQKFLKESKQFGSQRQESEKLAASIAIDNLSRSAGFSNPINFKWIMEGNVSDDIIKRAKTVKIDNYEISLDISSSGEIGLKTVKNDKLLKNIPVKHRKDSNIVKLKEAVKELKNQNKRTKEDLEQTMINSISFSSNELHGLVKHPVVGPLLKKLVLKVKLANVEENDVKGNHVKLNNVKTNNNVLFGFYEDNNKLKTCDSQLVDIPEDSQIMIAHSLDLYDNNLLSDYQKYVFDNSLIQPFKQIFREVYLLTPDEEKEKSISHRYAGNQIQTKVALSLFKSKAWSIDYKEGLKKIFRKRGYIAKVFALADWFSPADVESPTIETIEFINTEDYKTVPFDKVDRIDFSETMRDIDLVVSVAHAGDVDPEASHSTIEMRQSLIKETVRLLGIGNISLKKNHVIIEGNLASYSLHLGSGVVHKQPGGYISILPVHSQNRGRIFIPFADNDPKTAEIISKILLLSEDDKIDDSTILKQISTR